MLRLILLILLIWSLLRLLRGWLLTTGAGHRNMPTNASSPPARTATLRRCPACGVHFAASSAAGDCCSEACRRSLGSGS